MPVIKILGGHGHVALLLARELARKPENKVVSFIRNPTQEADVAETGAIPDILDIEHASVADFAAKLSGADFVVWSAGAGGKGGPERTFAIDRDAAIRSMQATRQVGGVSLYIMVSFLGADQAPQLPQSHPLYHYGQAKHAADQYLMHDSGLNWTIINPGTLNHDEPTGLVDFRVDPSHRNSRTISRSNVALVIASIIMNEKAAKHSLFKGIPCLDGDEPIMSGLVA